MYGYANKRFFNIKTGAIVIAISDGVDLGDNWKNMTDNPDWYPLFNFEGSYVGYRSGKKEFNPI